jgi:hypothetical protein
LTNKKREWESWCSICLNVAVFHCAATQPSENADVSCHVESNHSGEGKRGCGLKLCEKCATALLKLYAKDFGKFVNDMETVQFHGLKGSDSLRADVGFLTTHSLLMRNAT